MRSEDLLLTPGILSVSHHCQISRVIQLAIQMLRVHYCLIVNTVETSGHQPSLILTFWGWDFSLAKGLWELLKGPAGVRDAQCFVRSCIRMQRFLVKICFPI